MNYTISYFFILFMMIACKPSSTSENNNNQNSVTQSQVTEETLASLFQNRVSHKNADDALAGLGSLIHPELGACLLIREGNTDIVKFVKNADELKERLHNKKEIFNKMVCQVERTDELPEFNEAGEFSKKGCFTTSVPSIPLITDKIKFLQKELDFQFKQEEIDTALKIDSAVTDVIVLTDAFVELMFAKKENTWYLVGINLAKYDASL